MILWYDNEKDTFKAEISYNQHGKPKKTEEVCPHQDKFFLKDVVDEITNENKQGIKASIHLFGCMQLSDEKVDERMTRMTARQAFRNLKEVKDIKELDLEVRVLCDGEPQHE